MLRCIAPAPRPLGGTIRLWPRFDQPAELRRLFMARGFRHRGFSGSERLTCHICTSTGFTAATSAPGMGSPVPYLHRDRARHCHICAGTALCRKVSTDGLLCTGRQLAIEPVGGHFDGSAAGGAVGVQWSGAKTGGRHPTAARYPTATRSAGCRLAEPQLQVPWRECGTAPMARDMRTYRYGRTALGPLSRQ